MKKIGAFLLALVVLSAWSCSRKEPKTTCIYGNDIPQKELDTIIATSEALMDLLKKGDYEKLYDAGTQELKKAQNRDMFVKGIRKFVDTFGKIEIPRLEEVYMMESKAKEQYVWIPCNLGEPGVNDLYGLPANRRYAVAVYRAHTDMEEARVVFQLEQDGETWRLRLVTLNPLTLKKRFSEFYIKKALEYREQNKLHLAALYLKAALFLSELGPNVKEFETQTLTDQIGQIKTDYLPGGEIQIWATDSGNNYKVYNLDVAYEGGNLMVHLSYLTESLKDREKLRREARELALFLDEKFPEYREGFDGVRITAAPEAKEEIYAAYHTSFLFSELERERKKAETPKKKAPETGK